MQISSLFSALPTVQRRTVAYQSGAQPSDQDVSRLVGCVVAEDDTSVRSLSVDYHSSSGRLRRAPRDDDKRRRRHIGRHAPPSWRLNPALSGRGADHQRGCAGMPPVLVATARSAPVSSHPAMNYVSTTTETACNRRKRRLTSDERRPVDLGVNVKPCLHDILFL